MTLEITGVCDRKEVNMIKFNDIISSSNTNALEMLKENAAFIEVERDHMQKANDYYKTHKTVTGCPGIDDAVAAKLNERAAEDGLPFSGRLFKMNISYGNVSKANIWKLENDPSSVIKGWIFKEGEAVANLANNRLQLEFKTIPTKSRRNKLKSAGFKWAPKRKCWQYPLNDTTLAIADELEFIKPLDGRKPSELQQ